MTDHTDHTPGEIQRETGVPIPEEAGTHGTRRPRERYFFHQMDVGDSLFMPGTFRDLDSCPMYNAARKHGQRHGKTFYCKRYRDAGVRCWRVG